MTISYALNSTLVLSFFKLYYGKRRFIINVCRSLVQGSGCPANAAVCQTGVCLVPIHTEDEKTDQNTSIAITYVNYKQLLDEPFRLRSMFRQTCFGHTLRDFHCEVNRKFKNCLLYSIINAFKLCCTEAIKFSLFRHWINFALRFRCLSQIL